MSTLSNKHSLLISTPYAISIPSLISTPSRCTYMLFCVFAPLLLNLRCCHLPVLAKLFLFFFCSMAVDGASELESQLQHRDQTVLPLHFGRYLHAMIPVTCNR